MFEPHLVMARASSSYVGAGQPCARQAPPSLSPVSLTLLGRPWVPHRCALVGEQMPGGGGWVAAEIFPCFSSEAPSCASAPADTRALCSM